MSGAGHTLQQEAPCAKPRCWSRHGWPHYMVNAHNRDPHPCNNGKKMNDIMHIRSLKIMQDPLKFSFFMFHNFDLNFLKSIFIIFSPKRTICSVSRDWK